MNFAQTLTRKAIIEAGYQPYKDNLIDDISYVSSYHKPIRDEEGRKYSINVKEHDFSRLPNIPEVAAKTVFSAFVQFTTNEGETFDTHFHIRDTTTVEDIENFFEKLWVAMDCQYYD